MIPAMGPTTNRPPPTMTLEQLSLEELAKYRDLHARFMKNMAWFEAHVREIREHYSGKSICIAGETLFTGDDPAEVIARARGISSGLGSVFHYVHPVNPLNHAN